MAIGNRIKYLRKLCGLTQKELGTKLGFPERAADVRIAQYESEMRIPKENLVNEMSHIFDVSPLAINVPDIDTYYGVLHTLFSLEDTYGLHIDSLDGELCLRLDKQGSEYLTMLDMLSAWQRERERLQNGEITQKEYNAWRYNYPKSEAALQKQHRDEIRAAKNISK